MEEHLPACPSCREVLDFAAGFKRSLDAQASAHPAAEALVRYGEDASRLALQERLFIESHLERCDECARELSTLREVEADLAREQGPADAAGARPPARGRESLSRLRVWWDSLAGTLLRPAPAAAYLLAAVVLAVIVVRPAGQRFLIGPSSRTQADAPLVGGVTLLPNAGGGERGGAAESAPAPLRVDRSAQTCLLLELPDLEPSTSGGPIGETPIDAGSPYRVEMIPIGSSHPIWTGVVRGSAFRDNRTLCLTIPAGTLQPGSYSIRVKSPEGKAMFDSAIEAR